MKELKLDIYMPADIATPKPCVVWIHGGGLTTLDKMYPITVWSAAHAALAGYVSVSIDYRLMNEAPLPVAAVDCKAAIRFLRSHAAEYHINPDKISVAGEGAGGILAGFVAYADKSANMDTGVLEDVSSKVSCVIMWYANTWGPFNPIKHLSPDDPPTLYVQAGSDGNIGEGPSMAYKSACEANKTVVEVVSIANASHGLFDTGGDVKAYEQHMNDALAASVAFLEKHGK